MVEPATTPELSLLRLITEGHLPRRQESGQAELLLDRGWVEDWTEPGRWHVTSLGRRELARADGSVTETRFRPASSRVGVDVLGASPADTSGQ